MHYTVEMQITGTVPVPPSLSLTVCVNACMHKLRSRIENLEKGKEGEGREGFLTVKRQTKMVKKLIIY
jgi:hypothetical protein